MAFSQHARSAPGPARGSGGVRGPGSAFPTRHESPCVASALGRPSTAPGPHLAPGTSQRLRGGGRPRIPRWEAGLCSGDLVPPVCKRLLSPGARLPGGGWIEASEASAEKPAERKTLSFLSGGHKHAPEQTGTIEAWPRAARMAPCSGRRRSAPSERCTPVLHRGHGFRVTSGPSPAPLPSRPQPIGKAPPATPRGPTPHWALGGGRAGVLAGVPLAPGEASVPPPNQASPRPRGHQGNPRSPTTDTPPSACLLPSAPWAASLCHGVTWPAPGPPTAKLWKERRHLARGPN